jgi:hypothetical protein
MGKITKKVVKIAVATLSWLLLAALVLPLAVSLLVSVPAVQNALVQRLTTTLSQRLGTKIAIDGVDIRLINRVEVRGFYVEDYDGDTLLWVPRLVAPIEKLGLGGEQLTFGKVKLKGAQVWLRKSSPDRQMNISRMVDSIDPGPSNPDPKFRMRIAAIEADSLTFGLLRPYAGQREGADFSRFVMRDVNVRIEDFAIARDTIRMRINSLSGRERSGWVVDNLTALPLIVSRGAVTLTDVSIRSEGSSLRLPAIRLVGKRGIWRDFSEFSDSVAMNIDMRSSRVTTRLVGVFVPAVKGWGIELDGVEAHTRGALSSLTGGVKGAKTLGTTLSAEFTSRGLPRFRTARFDVKLTELESVGSDVAILTREITGCEPSKRLAALLSRQGVLSMTGEATGGLDDFTATATLVSRGGEVTTSARVRGSAVEGEVSTQRFDLGRTLNVKDLGAVSGRFDVKFTGAGGPATPRATIKGDVAGVGFRGYTYNDLTVGAELAGRRWDVNMEAADAALEGRLTAAIDRDGGSAAPRYDVDLNLKRLDLVTTHLNRADSVSVVSGHLMANIAGRGLDDADGIIELRDAVYRSERGVVKTSLATLEARNAGNRESPRRLTLKSEFVDAELRSQTPYRDMTRWMGRFLQRYIPGLGADPAREKRPVRTPVRAAVLAGIRGETRVASDGYSTVNLAVKDAGALLHAIAPSASIAPGTSAKMLFNTYSGAFSISARSEFVEYRDILATGLRLEAGNAADSLTVHLAAADIYSRRGHIPRVEIEGGSKVHGRLDISLDGRMWRLTADSLNLAKGAVALENMKLFPLDNPQQGVFATGVASARPADTMRLRLNDFDLSPLGTIVGGARGIDLQGRATGWLDVTALTGTPQIDADIDIDNLSADGHAAPPLHFSSRPDSQGGAGFRLTDRASGADFVHGVLSPGGDISARVRVDSLDASLLDPLLGGILENTRGKASTRLSVGGTLRAPRIDGHIDVPRFETTIAYTRARYTVEAARLEVTNSVLTLPSTPVINPRGGSGNLSMNINLTNLRNIRASIDARINSMLAFNTGPGDSEAFYGQVFATGSVEIRSDRMGTRMNISGRTDAGTRFHLPLNAKSNVSWADFVVFATPTSTPDTTGVLARTRLAYERRLAGEGQQRRSKPLELNLSASITPAAELHMLIDPNLGQGITSRGEGVIDMRINPQNDLFTMTGDYNIASGKFEFSMMDVFNKTFEIAPGSTLRWSGAADDALLGVDASWRVRTSLLPLMGGSSATGSTAADAAVASGSPLISGRSTVPVDCIIRLRESLSDPEITFDIALPSADPEARQIVANAINTQELKSMQFLSLLTTGSFATDNSIMGQSATAGVMATGAVGFDILTNQLNNFLSSEDYDIYFRYRPQDNFTSSQVDVGFSTRLWNDRLQLEIEGNYVDNREVTSVGKTRNVSNLAGDVSLTWVIDRAGNLRLKVFSQTIDRLNETQGLQESGLGIHYKKDFNNFRDIFIRNNRIFAPNNTTKSPGRRRKQHVEKNNN